jgi:hypothetical protein
MLVTSPDETDRTVGDVTQDPDPAVPGPEAVTPGVPAGSDAPSGESDFVDGIEVPGDAAGADAGAMETPIIPRGAADPADEATTED